MRRLTHYDYWQDRVRPSIPPRQRSRLTHLRYGRETGGGTCGKAETPTDTDGRPKLQKLIADIPQMVYLDKEVVVQEGDITLFSHEECLKDKRKKLPTSVISRRKATNIQHPASCKRAAN